ncbi:BirA family transcriptional regulator, biotin operon repressor / biotin-[acetyl-CoA-carboxylase] ligase [Geopseudomonas sagittaria]|uniref:Bifunctional ligase/repressor BirA n=1 Tax=Geopseudomonas sagittaria TaxID=1135990 RepID=A0A1I5WBF4_9GAMM|nr:bifunctional biotin--[acetyl-CoA-carboxylase] ligase/biotin operon repressor BirA [Pseudomonas sagittaria]SFQ17060.1 BirA family transcriptional regulator, biotin operon repressor / biotin-[acetyl-CoA-carboxylase] ligase [Pseudomonas sagittaria]
MQLLRLLADGRFHSGEELGQRLGISRSAVWKQLQQLQIDSEVRLHRVRGKGYRLEQPLSLLSAEAIRARLPGRRVWVEDRVDSTNALALRYLTCHEPPFVVLAEAQTAGRGRRGRHWVSPYGENLYFSQVIRIERSATQLQALSLVVGVAVLRTLRQLGVAGVGLKWPNDLLVEGKKIAGILLELSGDPADVCQVVIGVGINANMRAGSGIDQDWTSVCLETGRQVERSELAAALAVELEQVLRVHCEQGFAAFHGEWEASHAWQGREVRLISGVHEIGGTVLGVTIDGGLRLAGEGGEQVYSGGELSLRLQHDS